MNNLKKIFAISSILLIILTANCPAKKNNTTWSRFEFESIDAEAIGTAAAQISVFSAGIGAIGSSLSPTVGQDTYLSSGKVKIPLSFLDTNILEEATNGFVRSDEFFDGCEAQISLKTRAGNQVGAAAIGGKKIGILGDYEWNSYFDSEEPDESQIESFQANPKYERINTLAGYLIWSRIAPLYVQGRMGSDFPPISKPSPKMQNLVCSANGSIKLSTLHQSGNASFSIHIGNDGKPSYANGAATITRDPVTSMINFTVNYGANAYVTGLTLAGRTNRGFSFVVGCGANGAGNGYIYDSGMNKIAEILLNDDGSGYIIEKNRDRYDFTI